MLTHPARPQDTLAVLSAPFDEPIPGPEFYVVTSPPPPPGPPPPPINIQHMSPVRPPGTQTQHNSLGVLYNWCPDFEFRGNTQAQANEQRAKDLHKQSRECQAKRSTVPFGARFLPACCVLSF